MPRHLRSKAHRSSTAAHSIVGPSRAHQGAREALVGGTSISVPTHACENKPRNGMRVGYPQPFCTVARCLASFESCCVAMVACQLNLRPWTFVLLDGSLFAASAAGERSGAGAAHRFTSLTTPESNATTMNIDSTKFPTEGSSSTASRFSVLRNAGQQPTATTKTTAATSTAATARTELRTGGQSSVIPLSILHPRRQHPLNQCSPLRQCQNSIFSK